MSKAGTSVGIPDLRRMPAAELVKAEKAVKECVACTEAKAHRKALGHHGLDKGTRPGEVIHMDNFYSITRDPATDKKVIEHCLLAVDAYSEWRWADPKKSLADLPQAAIDIIQHSHTLNGRYPRLIITDLGSEFTNKVLKTFERGHGIQFQPSPARAKELNGLAEKNVDTTKNHTRAMMLAAANMPPEFAWVHAVQHFVYVWNRTHVGQHTGVTPYQSMTGREASVLNVGEFGCDVFVHQHRSQRDTTFGPKSLPGIYLGHSGRQNCPIVRMLHSSKLVLSKDVHFREGQFMHLRAMLKGRAEDVQPLDLHAEALVEPPSLQLPESESDAYETDDEFDLNSPLAAQRVRFADEKKYPEPDDPQAAPRYALRSIIDARVQDGIKQYRCKWTGFPTSSWEPAEIISEDAPDAVKAYERFIEQREQARATRAVTRSVSRADDLEQPVAAGAAFPPGPGSAPLNASADDENLESEPRVAATYAARCL